MTGSLGGQGQGCLHPALKAPGPSHPSRDDFASSVKGAQSDTPGCANHLNADLRSD